MNSDKKPKQTVHVVMREAYNEESYEYEQAVFKVVSSREKAVYLVQSMNILALPDESYYSAEWSVD